MTTFLSYFSQLSFLPTSQILSDMLYVDLSFLGVELMGNY